MTRNRVSIHGLMKKLFLAPALILSSILLAVAPASAAIVYSGANQNVTYSQNDFVDTFSLFGAAGTWDDIDLNLHVFEDSGFQNSYNFSTMLNVHGNYVQFALESGGDIARYAESDVIDSAITFSGNSYEDFSDYTQFFDFPSVSQSGEFRNQTGYAGIRMIDGPNTYYGWIQVSVTNYNNSSITGVLIDWAYESTPGGAIEAGAIPEPSVATLLIGATLFGASFLSRRRR